MRTTVLTISCDHSLAVHDNQFYARVIGLQQDGSFGANKSPNPDNQHELHTCMKSHTASKSITSSQLMQQLQLAYKLNTPVEKQNEKFTLPLNFFSSSLTSLTWIFPKALRRRYGMWITTAFLLPATSIWLQSHNKHRHPMSKPKTTGYYISTGDNRQQEETVTLHSIVDVQVLELELRGLKALQKYKYCYHTYIL